MSLGHATIAGCVGKRRKIDENRKSLCSRLGRFRIGLKGFSGGGVLSGGHCRCATVQQYCAFPAGIALPSDFELLPL